MGISSYKVYTMTSHIPAYILYQCPKCRNNVISTGSYDEAARYSDENLLETKKGMAALEKRKEAAEDTLRDKVTDRAEQLRMIAVPVAYDFRSVQCRCPKCGHSSLKRWGSSKNLTLKIAGVFAALGVFAGLIIGHVGFGASLFTAFFAMLIGYGLSELVVYCVDGLIIKSMIRKGVPPYASVSLPLLWEKTEEFPAYKGVEFSVGE